MYFAYNQQNESHFTYKKIIIMDKTNHISTLTTIAIDRQTGKLIDKLCKRYSLKKGEIVRLAFVYIDKACINPSEVPESVKLELAKMNKRQDDIIRFIRHYEEEQLNPMIRTANSIAVRFDTIGKTLETLILSQLESSQGKQTAVLQKVSEQFGKHADIINQQGKQLTALYQIHQRDYKKLHQLIQLYSELSACGVMDSKRKENLKAEIINLINT
jgi:clindamycin resistance transfer factor btgA